MQFIGLAAFVTTWSLDWTWGLPIIVLTVILHVLGLRFANDQLKRLQRTLTRRCSSRVVSLVIVSATVCSASILHGIEANIWAALYRLTGALPDYTSAVLYSLGAMTTYGHANVFLEKRWELLGALEALNGLLLFGVTTAFLINVLQKAKGLYDEDRPAV